MELLVRLALLNDYTSEAVTKPEMDYGLLSLLQ
jgi:hypothetical protein